MSWFSLNRLQGLGARRADRLHLDRLVPGLHLAVGGQSYPAPITSELTVSWSHRNRLGAWSYADSGKTATAEPGIEYDVLVYGELGTLVHTGSDLPGASFAYLEADEIAASGLGRHNNHLPVKIQTWGTSHTHVAIREIEWEFDRI